MAPRATARGVLSRAVATLRRHWRPLLLVAVVVFVPLGLLDVLDERFAELDPDELGTADAIGAIVIGLSRATTELFGEIMLSGAIVAAIGDVNGPGETRSLGEVLRGVPYARLAAITVLSVLGFALGLLLFIVPGIYFLGRYVLASPIAEVEHLGIREAFARSHELTRGHFWLVLVVLLPLSFLSGALSELAQTAGVELLGEGLAGEWAGATVAGVLISTPWALAAVSLVYELRSAEGAGARREGSRSTPVRPR
jgi:hypothetical protein